MCFTLKLNRIFQKLFQTLRRLYLSGLMEIKASGEENGGMAKGRSGMPPGMPPGAHRCAWHLRQVQVVQGPWLGSCELSELQGEASGTTRKASHA